MTRPALVDISHANESWDADVNANYAILRDGPIPLAEFPVALPAANAFDRCIAAHNHPDYGWSEVFSNGSQWSILQSLGLGASSGQETFVKHAFAEPAMAGAAVTVAGLIPAGCILLGVTTRVTIAIGGAASFDVGDGVTANLFADNTGVGLGSTSDLTDHLAGTWEPKLYVAAGDVVLTANGGNFSAGAVRVTVHYLQLTAPTS
jgi:hypothetical protein